MEKLTETGIVELITKKVNKKELSLNEGYMYIADYVSKSSVDPSTKVGAIIVSNGKILSCGHNRVLEGFENIIDWNNRNFDDWLNSKYPYILHAERDAIYKASRNLVDIKNASIYVNLFPCNECSIAIIASGIKKVYYCCDKYHDANNAIAARKLFSNCGIELEQIKIELGKDI